MAFYQGETRVNYFAQLVLDGNASVRLRFYAMVGAWITAGHDAPVALSVEPDAALRGPYQQALALYEQRAADLFAK